MDYDEAQTLADKFLAWAREDAKHHMPGAEDAEYFYCRAATWWQVEAPKLHPTPEHQGTIEEWLHASPDHEALLRAEPGGGVRATLRGERPDGRWLGVGATASESAIRALIVRREIRGARP